MSHRIDAKLIGGSCLLFVHSAHPHSFVIEVSRFAQALCDIFDCAAVALWECVADESSVYPVESTISDLATNCPIQARHFGVSIARDIEASGMTVAHPWAVCGVDGRTPTETLHHGDFR
jgi:hypothetical protein